MIPQVLPTSSQQLHTVVEEDEGRKEEIITSSEDSICVTRDILKNIVSNTLEEQKKQADANSQEAITSSYTEGIKKYCEIQGKPLLSSTIVQEQVMGIYLVNHNTIGSPEPMKNMLNEVSLLSPKGIDYITKQPIAANNVQTVQMAMKLSVSTTYSGTIGNETQQSSSSI